MKVFKRCKAKRGDWYEKTHYLPGVPAYFRWMFDQGKNTI
jgi:hypothetical protein